MHLEKKIMADKEGPQAPAPLGAHDPPAPQDHPPPQSPQAPLIPNAPQAPEASHVPTPHVPLLNWSHFKPEYSRKSDKYAEAHLLRTNDWMDYTNFRTMLRYKDFV